MSNFDKKIISFFFRFAPRSFQLVEIISGLLAASYERGKEKMLQKSRFISDKNGKMLFRDTSD